MFTAESPVVVLDLVISSTALTKPSSFPHHYLNISVLPVHVQLHHPDRGTGSQICGDQHIDGAGAALQLRTVWHQGARSHCIALRPAEESQQ